MSQKHSSRAIVIALIGELGAGKTTFVQKFARAYGILENITSPTFVIFKKYDTFVHIDAYRLKNSKELMDLGFQKFLDDPNNVICIEWADRVLDILPEDRITIHFDHVDKTTRKIRID